MKTTVLTMLLWCVTALCGLAQANTDVYYARRSSHFETLPIHHNDIIMLGNSLTDGAEWNELLDNPDVKNRGIIGDIVQGAIERIGPILSGQPAKVFILCGVNDVSHGVTADSIGRVMEELIWLLKQFCPTTQIYLQSMLPFNNEVRLWKNLKDRDHVVVEGNRILEEVARRNNVTWINLYPLFDDGTGHLKKELTNDGLHLMGKGYLIWRDAIKPYVDQ